MHNNVVFFSDDGIMLNHNKIPKKEFFTATLSVN